MENTWTKALKASISEVFSTMFFMVPEDDEALSADLPQRSAKGWLEGWVDITRDGASLRIWVWSPPELARELAANILSLDPGEASADDVQDAYAEMINMVAGSVLTAVDKEGAWKLGLPQAGQRSEGNLDAVAAQANELLCFEVEAKPMLAGITTRGGA